MPLTLLSRPPPPIAPDPRQFFGPLNQPKWTQVDVKKVRGTTTQIDGKNGIRKIFAIGVYTCLLSDSSGTYPSCLVPMFYI